MAAAGIRYAAAMVGSTFRGLHESIVNHPGPDKPTFIACVHEEISAAMAHGYAKVAGAPMACLVHSTVGLQHASMAIFNAFCDHVPIMILAGNIQDETKRRPGVEWFHTAQDLGAFVRDFTKWDDNPVTLQHFAESFMRGHEMGCASPAGPVLIVADGELQEHPIEDRAALHIPARAAIAPPGADPAAMTRAAAMMVKADRAVIVVERSARSQEGIDLLVRLAERLNVPVIDKAGRMNMPTGHYLNRTSDQARLLRQADLILALECSDLWGMVNSIADLSVRTSKRIVPADAKVIAVSASYGTAKANIQDLQRYFPADLTIAADAQACMPQLIEQIDAALDPARRATIAARREPLSAAFAAMRDQDARAAAIGWDASPVSTARLSMEVWEQIKDLDWGLVSSSTFISSWPQRLWDMDRFHHYIGAEGGYGVGYGAPAAAGAALAHRDAGRIPIAIQTDGDLMVLPGTLWTLAHHHIPLLMVMHNNRAWHQETMHLTRMVTRRNRGGDGWRIGTVMTDPAIDFAGMARSMGVWAEGPIDDPAKLAPAIKRALAIVKSGRPALLDVLTQPR